MAVWKGTWLHRLPETQAGIRLVVDRLADAGFDMLIPCVKQPDGIADYPSKLAHIHPPFQGWDALRICAEESNRAGLPVHGWICVFPEGKNSALLEAHPEYAAQPGPERGRCEVEHGLACPNRPEVQDYEAGLYRELMDYPIAGVSLDYIRFIDGTCYCDYCREDFRRQTGGDLHKLGFFGWDPAAAQDMDVWIAWRCEVINRFVRRIRAMTREHDKELSASVFQYYPSGLQDIGQDWEYWVREGLVDYIWPMNYSSSTLIASKWARNNIATLADSTTGCRLHEGIHRPKWMTTDRWIRHVAAILETGVKGVVIFDYPNLTDADLKALARLDQ